MSIGSSSFKDAHTLVERISDQCQIASQSQDDLQLHCSQVKSWEASFVEREAACLVVFKPRAICLPCTARTWRTGEESLDDLFIADDYGPVSFIFLDAQVVPFFWLIDLEWPHVRVAICGSDKVSH